VRGIECFDTSVFAPSVTKRYTFRRVPLLLRRAPEATSPRDELIDTDGETRLRLPEGHATLSALIDLRTPAMWSLNMPRNVNFSKNRSTYIWRPCGGGGKSGIYLRPLLRVNF
jgi:hypothetical protein